MTQDQKDFNQAMDDYSEYLKNLHAEQAIVNKSVLDSAGLRWEDLDELCENVCITDILSIVDEPMGIDDGESYEKFSRVFIDQQTGHLGDNYSGNIYAKLESGKWLKIPYEC